MPSSGVTMRDEMNVVRWLEVIRAEYQEVPGLNLTKPQMQRLWGLDAVMCDALVDALTAARVLRPGHRGTYVLNSSR
jgi:hypothetical protein